MGKILGRRYRFVDDYKKQVYVGANGRSKQRIIYIGQWVCPQNDEAAYKRIVLISRIAVGVLVLALVGALLVVPLPYENKWYMPVTAVAFFPLAYAVMGVFRMPDRVKPMERQRFANSFERARGAAIASLIILGIAMLAYIVCTVLILTKVIGNQTFTLRDGAYALCMALAGAACLTVVRETKKIKTELRENAACKPE